MSKITEKNTKKEILEALRATEAELKATRELTTTTVDKIEEKRKETVKETAAKVAEEEILNPIVIEKYKSLIEASKLIEKEIEETHEIKKSVDTLEALYVLYAKKEIELKNKYDKYKEELEEDYKCSKNTIIEELKEQEELNKKKIAALKENYTENQKDLELKRKRETEIYEYNLNRKREIENDEWEDKKALREKMLQKREDDVELRENNIKALEKKVVDYEALIENTKKEMEELMLKKVQEEKAKMEKTFAIKEASVKKDAEWQKKILDEKISILEQSISSKDYEINSLKEKLDEAYSRIQKMAIAQSNANGRMFPTENFQK